MVSSRPVHFTGKPQQRLPGFSDHITGMKQNSVQILLDAIRTNKHRSLILDFFLDSPLKIFLSNFTQYLF